MATTLGELSRRISELRSRVAVIEGLIRYTAANYLSGSGGHITAEMRFALDGGGWVPEEHVVLASEELEGVVAALRVELSTLEAVSVELPEPDVESPDEGLDDPEQDSVEGGDEAAPSTEPEVVAEATPLRKKKADVRQVGAGSEDSPEAAPRQGAA